MPARGGEGRAGAHRLQEAREAKPCWDRTRFVTGQLEQFANAQL